jgi:hypothetical protein
MSTDTYALLRVDDLPMIVVARDARRVAVRNR